jgi:hypothetical protein
MIPTPRIDWAKDSADLPVEENPMHSSDDFFAQWNVESRNRTPDRNKRAGNSAR